MARMIPPQLRPDTESAAEELLFSRMASDLPGDYTVLHGVEWTNGHDLADYEADFIVAHPVRGVLVLEVKGGLVSVDPKLSQWSSEDINGISHLIKDPFRQVKRTMYALLDLLRDTASIRDFNYGVMRAVVFPDTTVEAADFPALPRNQIIDRRGLSNLRQALERVWGDHPSPDPGKEGVDALVRLLVGNKAPTMRDRIVWESEEVQRHTEEQRTALRMMSDFKRLAVSGVAGSGKTMLALEECRRAARAGDRVLFTCHNLALSAFAQQTLMKDLGPLMSKVRVQNYHELAHEFALRAGLDVPATLPFAPDLEDFYDNVLPGQFSNAIDRFPESRFDTIVVDEGQDFTDTWWVTLEMLLADPASSRLRIFYDDYQNIFSRRGTYPIPRPHVNLTKNCRNTQRIHQAVMAFHGNDAAVDCPGPVGREPIEVEISAGGELQALRKVVHQLVVVERIPLEDILVLSLCMHSDSALQEGTHIGNFMLTWGVPGKDTVRCRSIYSFKGLESPVVILADLDRIDPVKQAQLLYTAMSRAQHHLVVLGSLPAQGDHVHVASS